MGVDVRSWNWGMEKKGKHSREIREREEILREIEYVMKEM